MALQTGILLESGTNEVEVAEFVLGDQRFGVNVAKVREFIPRKGVSLTKPPGAHPSIVGMFHLRGHNIPLINLAGHLGLPDVEDSGWQVVVITEFNNLTSAFVAERIEQIHRVSWENFQPINRLISDTSPMVTGSIHIGEKEVLVLDLEHIIGEIFPETVINFREDEHEPTDAERRAAHPIVFAEDSALIRKQVSKVLNTIGYTNLTAYSNGQDAYDAVAAMAAEAKAQGKPITDWLSLVLTDIEMPRMDGLTLCRRVKQELGLEVPVVMFSSLINEQMSLKCQAVGADGVASKPETTRLIEMIDGLILG